MEQDASELEALLYLVSQRQLWSYGLELAIVDGVIVLRELAEKPETNDELYDQALGYLNARAFAKSASRRG